MQTLQRSIFGVLTLGILFSNAPAFSQEKKAGPTIEVKVNYTGTGTVDEKHKIYVIVWDSVDFTQGGIMPVSIQSTNSKTGTVTFADVKIPAYLSAAYDPTGSWDGASGPPATGTSLGLYSKTPGTPEPIKAASGETAKGTLEFDDSMKMPYSAIPKICIRSGRCVFLRFDRLPSYLTTQSSRRFRNPELRSR